MTMARPRARAWWATALASAFVLTLLLCAAAPAPVAARLPSRYSRWGVTVAQPPDAPPGMLDLGFTSPALGRRVKSTVYLPASYRGSGAPTPTLYYLHGTVTPQLDQPAAAPITSVTRELNTLMLVSEVGPNGGALQTAL